MAKKNIKKENMSDETFAEMMESAEQVLEYEGGAGDGSGSVLMKRPRKR
jgi:hypothetical protein